MTETKSKTEYKILFAIGVLVIVALWPLVRMGTNSDDESLYLPSSKSSNVNGCLLFYTLCERLGYSIIRSEKAFGEAFYDQAGVWIMLDPWVHFSVTEQDQMKSWVAAGGILVTNEGHSLLDSLPSPFGTAYSNSDISDEKLYKAIVSKIPADSDAGVLSGYVSKIVFENRKSFSDEQFASLKFKASVLFRDKYGIRILEYTYGKGRFICVSDFSFLKNRCMVYHDNPILSANLVAYAVSKAKGNTIIYDEYHYGSGLNKTGMGILTSSLLRTSAGWSIVTIFGAGILWIIMQGKQFGPRFPLYQNKKRRSKMEFVQSLAATYRAAGANRFCLQMIDAWFKTKLTSLAGLTSKASNIAIASALAGRDLEFKALIIEALNESERLLSMKKITEKSLLSVIHKFKIIEGEIYRENRRSTINC